MTRRGADAEALARAHLEAAGLRFEAANVSFPEGELDLVMREGDELVMVEVRHRADPAHGRAVESLSRTKLRRISLAAQRYLARCPDGPDAMVRFDVVALDGPLDSAELTWVRSAFDSAL